MCMYQGKIYIPPKIGRVRIGYKVVCLQQNLTTRTITISGFYLRNYRYHTDRWLRSQRPGFNTATRANYLSFITDHTDLNHWHADTHNTKTKYIVVRVKVRRFYSEGSHKNRIQCGWCTAELYLDSKQLKKHIPKGFTLCK